MSVNVEEIMSGIRAEIQEKGYSSDMLSFADVPADAAASARRDHPRLCGEKFRLWSNSISL